MIPVSTRTKLENKQAIMPKDRRDILTGIYQDLTSFEGGLQVEQLLICSCKKHKLALYLYIILIQHLQEYSVNLQYHMW